MAGTFNKALGALIQKSHITQVIDALDGTVGKGVALKVTQVSDNVNPALTIKNAGTGGALVVQASDGSTLLQVTDAGVFIAGTGLDANSLGRLILMS